MSTCSPSKTNPVNKTTTSTSVSGGGNSKKQTPKKSQPKIETGKSKKGLPNQPKQQDCPEQQQQDSQQSKTQSQGTSSATRSQRVKRKNSNGNNKVAMTTNVSSTNSEVNPDGTVCSTLEDFSKCAQIIKANINKALEKQAVAHQITDQPIEIVKLKEEMLRLSELENLSINDDKLNTKDKPSGGDDGLVKDKEVKKVGEEPEKCQTLEGKVEEETLSGDNVPIESKSLVEATLENDKTEELVNIVQLNTETSQNVENSATAALDLKEQNNLVSTEDKDDNNVIVVDNNLITQQQIATQSDSPKSSTTSIQRNQLQIGNKVNSKDKTKVTTTSSGFEPLNAKLDANSKVIALVSSLLNKFNDGPHLLEAVCRKLVDTNEQNNQLVTHCERYRAENQKLLLVRAKLENLCRELKKLNNALKIESLDMIKTEQSKAKEQTTKIQSTLSGVIKLFDENQQRNMSLRQENQELQNKLKSLLDHCDNWEKSVEVALRQRDIENRLIKTELAKANLLKNEEKEKFLGEKQELLQILSIMREQQHRIEGQEAKLRSDLSSYASKYDECQAVISKGMNRFQTESKKMLKQIEKSKQDYRVLLTKYEISNRTMVKLSEEKQTWDKAMKVANKKIVTLEKLCRALKEEQYKQQNDFNKTASSSDQAKQSSSGGGNNKNGKPIGREKDSMNNDLKAKELIKINDELDDLSSDESNHMATSELVESVSTEESSKTNDSLSQNGTTTTTDDNLGNKEEEI